MTELHSIDAAVFDLKLGTGVLSWPELASGIERELLPLVEAAFDGLNVDCTLDRIDVDLGSVPFDGNWRPVRQRFAQRLDAELRLLRSPPRHSVVDNRDGSKTQDAGEHADLSSLQSGSRDPVQEETGGSQTGDDGQDVIETDGLLLQLSALASSSEIDETTSRAVARQLTSSLGKAAPARLRHLQRLLSKERDRARPFQVVTQSGLSSDAANPNQTAEAHMLGSSPTGGPLGGDLDQWRHRVEAGSVSANQLASMLSLRALQALLNDFLKRSLGDSAHQQQASMAGQTLFLEGVERRRLMSPNPALLLAHIISRLGAGQTVDLEAVEQAVQNRHPNVNIQLSSPTQSTDDSGQDEAVGGDLLGTRSTIKGKSGNEAGSDVGHQSTLLSPKHAPSSIGRLALAIQSRLIGWQVIAAAFELEQLQDFVQAIKPPVQRGYLYDVSDIAEIVDELDCREEDVLAIAIVASMAAPASPSPKEASFSLRELVREWLAREKTAEPPERSALASRKQPGSRTQAVSSPDPHELRVFLELGEAVSGSSLVWHLRRALGQSPSVFQAWFKEAIVPPGKMVDDDRLKEALTRLSALLPEVLLRKVAHALAPSGAKRVLSLFDYLGDIIIAGVLARVDEHALARRWPILLRHLLVHGDAADTEAFCRDLIMAGMTPAGSDLTSELRRICTADQAMMQDLGSSGAKALYKVLNIAVDETRTAALTDIEGAEIVAEESGRISCAGVVLAAPFLPRLFAMCELVEDGQFFSENHVSRAVRLLHRLAYGEDEALHGQSRLAAILASAEDVTLAPVQLSEHEQELAESLIMTMIKQWTIIGNTTPQGLRESFLQRSGHLQRRESAWHLEVEERAFDMLLDQLPWSFSVIKHPWMPAPIHVHWR